MNLSSKSSSSGATVKIVHYRKNCIGCHVCVALAPNTWGIDPQDGKSFLKEGYRKGEVMIATIFPCDRDANTKAAQSCPMQIIQLGKVK